MIKVYFEPNGSGMAAERRYWRQSNEAEAAGHPYIAIRPRKTFAKICCDWITTPPATRASKPRPSDNFARMAADHLARCWPAAKVENLGSYTLLSLIPLSQAEPIAEDIAALATLALRKSEMERQS